MAASSSSRKTNDASPAGTPARSPRPIWLTPWRATLASRRIAAVTGPIAAKGNGRSLARSLLLWTTAKPSRDGYILGGALDVTITHVITAAQRARDVGEHRERALVTLAQLQQEIRAIANNQVPSQTPPANS
jgi:hypothetical protein